MCLLVIEASCVPVYWEAVKSLGEEQFAEMLAIFCCHCNAKSLVILSHYCDISLEIYATFIVTS